jgi:hypothetical protein
MADFLCGKHQKVPGGISIADFSTLCIIFQLLKDVVLCRYRVKFEISERYTLYNIVVSLSKFKLNLSFEIF